MYNHLSSLPDWVYGIIMPLNRWLHIVCTTMLVGGTLFYEFVIPKAIEDLKSETQLAVLGRVRWIFRRIVLISAALLIISGVISSWRQWPGYIGPYNAAHVWWVWHSGLGIIAIAIAVRLTIGDRVPPHPIAWLRINFVILLLVIFLAGVARYVRLSIQDYQQQFSPSNIFSPPLTGDEPKPSSGEKP